MNVYKCDKCQDTIDDIENITHISLGHMWERVELCPTCAEPVAEILKNSEILKESWYKTLQKPKQEV